jgi:hypothetical protein
MLKNQTPLQKKLHSFGHTNVIYNTKRAVLDDISTLVSSLPDIAGICTIMIQLDQAHEKNRVAVAKRKYSKYTPPDDGLQMLAVSTTRILEMLENARDMDPTYTQEHMGHLLEKYTQAATQLKAEPA